MKVLNYVILPLLLVANVYFVFNGPFDGGAVFNAYAAGFVTAGICSAIIRDLFP